MTVLDGPVAGLSRTLWLVFALAGCGYLHSDGDDELGFEGSEADATSGSSSECAALCEFPNATGRCDASGCRLDACAVGFVDLDGERLNGCEYACLPRVEDDGGDPENEVDDDCDGHVDEGVARTSGAEAVCVFSRCPVPPHAVPTCEGGRCGWRCLPGRVDRDGQRVNGCEDHCLPSADRTETACDGVDDDCDGRADERYQPPLEDCADGCAPSCVDGRIVCDRTDAEEVCNGVDDDCDGRVDEAVTFGLPSCGVGACVVARRCVDGLPTCTPLRPADTDAECDGIDEDCDGRIDEDAPDPETVAPCEGAMNACAPLPLCVRVDGSNRLVCPARFPLVERCNARDDDCDGRVDEGVEATVTQGPMACARARCEAGARVPEPGRVEPEPGCSDDAPDCGCDGVDADCDGFVDEDFARVAEPCDTQDACPRREVCIGGEVACAPRAEQVSDGCDGIDDDCDGRLDEDAGPVPFACGLGVCRAVAACASGRWLCEAARPDVAEVDVRCDGEDADCDGAIDEGYRPPAGDGCADACGCDGCNCDADGCGCGFGVCRTPAACVDGGLVCAARSVEVIEASPDGVIVRLRPSATAEATTRVIDGQVDRHVAGELDGFDLPDGAGVDLDCDGLDGDFDAAVLVAAAPPPHADAATVRVAPDLTAAIALAVAEGRPHVYLRHGAVDLPQSVCLPAGISLYGGFSDDWLGPRVGTTTLRFGAPVGLTNDADTLGAPCRGAIGQRVAPVLEGLDIEVGVGARTAGILLRGVAGLAVRGVTISVPSAAPALDGEAGGNAYGLAILGGEGVVVEDSAIFVGSGGAGGRGAAGARGQPGAPGQEGAAGAFPGYVCGEATAEASASGEGGSANAEAGVEIAGCLLPDPPPGGAGGPSHCGQPPAGTGGRGGDLLGQAGAAAGGPCDCADPACGCAAGCLVPGAGGDAGGADPSALAGCAGGNGPPGASGAPSVGLGRLVDGHFRGCAGRSGAAGGPAQGGGGGAGGAGVDVPALECDLICRGVGGGGGGGGAGGCGGLGGEGGGPGGAAFGVALPDCAGCRVGPGVSIQVGWGGTGGLGGLGGAGGVGGRGGFGGRAVNAGPSSGPGGPGGVGGVGGDGGPGSGGAAACVFASPTVIVEDLSACDLGGGGLPGDGDPSHRGPSGAVLSTAVLGGCP